MPYPKMLRLQQSFARPRVDNIPAAVRPHPDLGGLLRYRTDVLSARDAERLAARIPVEVAALSAHLV